MEVPSIHIPSARRRDQALEEVAKTDDTCKLLQSIPGDTT